MFVYCGNNPICYSDPHGYFRFDIDTVNISDDYDEVVEPVMPDHLDIGPRSEMAQQVDRAIGEAFNSLFDEKRIMNGAKAGYGFNKIRSGVKMINNGGLTIALPVPTPVEDIVGGIAVAYGIFSVFVGGLEVLFYGLSAILYGGG